MKIESLFESPPQFTYTQEFGLDNEKQNIKQAHKVLTDNRKIPLEKFGNGEYTLYELPRKYALIDHSEDEPKIIYYMQFELNFHKFIGRKCAQQVIVWSDTKHPVTENIPKAIFFDHLLYKYQTIITDSMQTPDGQRFWDRRITNSLEKNYFVYYVNLLPQREITRINNYKEYKQLANSKEIWGDGTKHQARRIIITTKELN